MLWEIVKEKILKGVRVLTKQSEEHLIDCPYRGKIESMEQQIEKINSTCCSVTNMEQRIKTNLLLEQLNQKIDSMNIKLEESEETLEQYKRYLHILLGIFIAIQFFGLDEKIKTILLGA